MQTCPNCGRENPDDVKFCDECGSALEGEAVTVGELRKLVTVVRLVALAAAGRRIDTEIGDEAVLG